MLVHMLSAALLPLCRCDSFTCGVSSQVYHLASVRLRDLCARLDIMPELRRKIWTCFEYSLVHCTDMMMDRHLDQLLMCAVYVMAKVSQVLHCRDNELRDEGRCSETHKEEEQVQFRKARGVPASPAGALKG